MQKWEYCAIVGIRRADDGLNPYRPGIWHFTELGIQSTRIEKPEADEVAKTIAQLGEQGWEMVGAGSTVEGSQHVLYFKRPRP
jgi:hypothetical protein